MKSVFVAMLTICLTSAVWAQKRPPITGIDHISLYSTNPGENAKLYGTTLGLELAAPLEGGTQRFVVGNQWVGYSELPADAGKNRLDHIAFATGDAEKLRNYMQSKGISVPAATAARPDGGRSFRVKDPEGNLIEFVEHARGAHSHAAPPAAVSRRLIHVGFVARSSEAEDKFFREVLGFRPYWQGGMKPGTTDWFALQVPDGTDWLEYMLNQPADPDQRLMGILNHISLGVVDMNAAAMQMADRGWRESGEEHTQVGRDGKLQLNTFDPDRTRVELMEFKPVDKPCCSQYTGPHPRP